MDNVTQLHRGDPRAGELAQAIRDMLHERAGNWPSPLVIGVLEIVKHDILSDLYEAQK